MSLSNWFTDEERGPHDLELLEEDDASNTKSGSRCFQCKQCCLNIAIRQHGIKKFVFIHSTWEIVQAFRKTLIWVSMDYVVYRFLYPLLIVVLLLYSLSKTPKLLQYAFYDIWICVVHVLYSFLFLGHVLQNNRCKTIHQSGFAVTPVKEFIEVRFRTPDGVMNQIRRPMPVLVRGNIGKTEQLLLLLAPIIYSGRLLIFLEVCTEQIIPVIKENEILWKNVLISGGHVILVFVEIYNVPIPINYLHFIYPIIFINLHVLFVYLYYKFVNSSLLYTQFNWSNTQETLFVVLGLNVIVFLLHCILAKLGNIRDAYIREWTGEEARKERERDLITGVLRRRQIHAEHRDMSRFSRTDSRKPGEDDKWRLKPLGVSLDEKGENLNEWTEEYKPVDKEPELKNLQPVKKMRSRPLPFEKEISRHKSFTKELNSILNLYTAITDNGPYFGKPNNPLVSYGQFLHPKDKKNLEEEPNLVSILKNSDEQNKFWKSQPFPGRAKYLNVKAKRDPLYNLPTKLSETMYQNFVNGEVATHHQRKSKWDKKYLNKYTRVHPDYNLPNKDLNDSRDKNLLLASTKKHSANFDSDQDERLVQTPHKVSFSPIISAQSPQAEYVPPKLRSTLTAKRHLESTSQTASDQKSTIPVEYPETPSDHMFIETMNKIGTVESEKPSKKSTRRNSSRISPSTKNKNKPSKPTPTGHAFNGSSLTSSKTTGSNKRHHSKQ